MHLIWQWGRYINFPAYISSVAWATAIQKILGNLVTKQKNSCSWNTGMSENTIVHGKCQLDKSINFLSHQNGGMGIKNICLNFHKCCHIISALRDPNHISLFISSCCIWRSSASQSITQIGEVAHEQRHICRTCSYTHATVHLINYL